MNLVFATNNPNKLLEVQAQLPLTIQLSDLKSIGCTEDIVEDAPTIEGNALIKARHVFQNYGKNCFADDTGLLVSALNGEPGVYSARYAGPNGDSEKNMAKLLKNLKGRPSRSAHFKTVVALIIDGNEYLFDGLCQGEITEKPSGDKGFGYDPIFKPYGYDVTFAEMSISEKGAISHRGLAIKKLIHFLSDISE
ncbi:MAG: non-canonical purine NTP diphosphatase [Leeuwenhoekiella sp.]